MNSRTSPDGFLYQNIISFAMWIQVGFTKTYKRPQPFGCGPVDAVMFILD